MDPQTVGLLIAALFGGGGITALVQTFTTRKTAEADATATLSGVWMENLERLDKDIKALRERVAHLEQELAVTQERERVLRTILIENRIDIPQGL